MAKAARANTDKQLQAGSQSDAEAASACHLETHRQHKFTSRAGHLTPSGYGGLRLAICTMYMDEIKNVASASWRLTTHVRT